MDVLNQNGLYVTYKMVITPTAGSYLHLPDLIYASSKISYICHYLNSAPRGDQGSGLKPSTARKRILLRFIVKCGIVYFGR
jgi:hypothetical protein